MSTERPVAVVTGATGGMGREIVRELATTHTVVALGRNQEALDELAHGADIAAVRCDITDAAQISQIAERLPRVDVLVHAAAIADKLSVEDATETNWTTALATNVVAPALLTRVLLPQLREASATVIFIGSGASTRATPGNAVYTATKHALRAIADVLRLDESDNGVRVVTLAPGPTDTEMLRSLIPANDYDAEKYIQPATVASAVRSLVTLNPDAHITDVALRPRAELKR